MRVCRVVGNPNLQIRMTPLNKNYKPRKNLWINILSAGEGFHDFHHNNEKIIRYHKWDIAGFIIEKFIVRNKNVV